MAPTPQKVIHDLCLAYRSAEAVGNLRQRDAAFTDILALPTVARQLQAISGRYQIAGTTTDDLRQELLIQVVIAIQIFDPNLGYFSSILAKICNRRLCTLVSRDFRQGHGEKANHISNLDDECDDTRLGDTRLGDLISDPKAKQPLNDICTNETMTNLIEYITPKLSPFEAQVFKWLIVNKLNCGAADYASIEKRLLKNPAFHKVLKGKTGKSGKTKGFKAIDNAMCRIKRTMARYKTQVDQIVRGYHACEEDL